MIFPVAASYTTNTVVEDGSVAVLESELFNRIESVM